MIVVLVSKEDDNYDDDNENYEGDISFLLEDALTACQTSFRCHSSFLCFERTKAPSPKNIVVPLTDITRLEKVS